MQKFYSQVLSGKTYTTSLRNSKLEMIKTPATANPMFWSGFVLIGN